MYFPRQAQPREESFGNKSFYLDFSFVALRNLMDWCCCNTEKRAVCHHALYPPFFILGVTSMTCCRETLLPLSPFLIKYGLGFDYPCPSLQHNQEGKQNLLLLHVGTRLNDGKKSKVGLSSNPPPQGFYNLNRRCVLLHPCLSFPSALCHYFDW